MLTRLALKEIRETAWIALIALAGYLYFLSNEIGIALLPGQGQVHRQAIPFVSGEFLASFAVISVSLAIALGFWQSAVEWGRGTFLFLLHRPASRMALIGTKLWVGLGLYLICSLLPIVIYAAWAATPGTHASPFEWSMTAMIFKLWVTITILYLGSFLAGIRPARWYGTRLIPLAAVAIPAVAIPLLPWWPILGLPAVVLLDLVLVCNVFFVARTSDF